jgi:hypothetical protein
MKLHSMLNTWQMTQELMTPRQHGACLSPTAQDVNFERWAQHLDSSYALKSLHLAGPTMPPTC